MKQNSLVLKIFLIFIIFILASCASINNFNKPNSMNTTSFHLPNKMKVILINDPATEAATIQAWVKVGNANEEKSEHGIAHIFEHMLFKGTEKYGLGEVSKQIESSGGNINAHTTLDSTVYKMNLPSNKIETGLAVMEQALFHSTFDAHELKKELEVIQEEYRRAMDSPDHKLFMDFMEHAYSKHPYRLPTLGTPASISATTRKKILNFYHKWYVPENITLVVAGNIDTKQLRPKIQNIFRDDSGKMATYHPTTEPEQLQAKSFITTNDQLQATMIMIGFHSTALKDPDTATLDILASILGGLETSRLDERIKKQKNLVKYIDAGNFTPTEPGIFFIDASLDFANIEKVLASIAEQLDDIITKRISFQELKKARNALNASRAYHQQTTASLASEAGNFDRSAGDYKYEDTYYNNINTTTTFKLRRAVKRYLRPENLTLGIITNKKNITNQDPKKLAKKYLSILTNYGHGHTSLKIPKDTGNSKVHKYQLANGITVIHKPQKGKKIIAVNIGFLGGLIDEDEKTNGIHKLLASMMEKGTIMHSEHEINQQFEEHGTNYHVFTGNNSFGLDATILSQYFSKDFPTILEILQYPEINTSDLAKEKQQMLLGLKFEKDNLTRLAILALKKQLYGKHSYALNRKGNVKSIPSFTLKQLHTLHKEIINPKNMVITIVGDISNTAFMSLLQNIEATNITHQLRKQPQITSPTKVVTIQQEQQKKQLHTIIGFLAPTLQDPDKYTLSIIQALLDGLSGRLFHNLRDKKSLAYSVSTIGGANYFNGYHGIYIASDPSKKDTILDAIHQEIIDLQTTDTPLSELQRAKEYLIGNHSLSLQTTANHASSLLFDDLYHLGFQDYEKYADHINKVTVTDIKRVSKKLFPWDKRIEVFVGPQS